MNIYQENGFASRREYLSSLAEEFGVPLSVVNELSGALGRDEDFDGLVTEMEDYADNCE